MAIHFPQGTCSRVATPGLAHRIVLKGSKSAFVGNSMKLSVSNQLCFISISIRSPLLPQRTCSEMATPGTARLIVIKESNMGFVGNFTKFDTDIDAVLLVSVYDHIYSPREPVPE